MPDRSRFDFWLDALAARHLRDLSFTEVVRGLRALSSTYVERRDTTPSVAALGGAAKRAAFALFYGPLHWLITREVVRGLGIARQTLDAVIDLGSGTGAAGAAFVLECAPDARLSGIDRHPWAVRETRWTYSTLGIKGSALAHDIARVRLPGPRSAIVAAYTLNELRPEAREVVLGRLERAHAHGASVLIIEPVAKRLAPWWESCVARFEAAPARSNEWHFDVQLPDLVARMDRAAGLDHRPLTARSLWLQSEISARRGRAQIDR